jgi:hypothetical protein
MIPQEEKHHTLFRSDRVMVGMMLINSSPVGRLCRGFGSLVSLVRSCWFWDFSSIQPSDGDPGPIGEQRFFTFAYPK